MSDWYRLNPDHSIEPAPETSEPAFKEYSNWLYGHDELGHPNKRVAATEVGEVLVSTVFLGLDHRHSHDGPPIVFETLVFGGPSDGDGERYSTWDEAVAGHKRICDGLESGLSREELEKSLAIILPLLKS